MPTARNSPSDLAERVRSLVDRWDGGNEAAAARRVGISQPAMHYLLKGESWPKGETVVRLARAYQVSADWILGLDQTNTTEELQRLRQLVDEIRHLTGGTAIPANPEDWAPESSAAEDEKRKGA